MIIKAVKQFIKRNMLTCTESEELLNRFFCVTLNLGLCNFYFPNTTFSTFFATV